VLAPDEAVRLGPATVLFFPPRAALDGAGLPVVAGLVFLIASFPAVGVSALTAELGLWSSNAVGGMAGTSGMPCSGPSFVGLNSADALRRRLVLLLVFGCALGVLDGVARAAACGFLAGVVAPALLGVAFRFLGDTGAESISALLCGRESAPSSSIAPIGLGFLPRRAILVGCSGTGGAGHELPKS
jgi:hypothetical protein